MTMILSIHMHLVSTAQGTLDCDKCRKKGKLKTEFKKKNKLATQCPPPTCSTLPLPLPELDAEYWKSNKPFLSVLA